MDKTQQPPAKKQYYHPLSWKNVKMVYQCDACGTFRDDVDAMIEHVLLHIPQNEQEKVFDELIKEINNK